MRKKPMTDSIMFSQGEKADKSQNIKVTLVNRFLSYLTL